jgi:hypothetical protein
MNGRSASPWRIPRPITAPIVAAAATVPTRIPVTIRDAFIARKETVVTDALKGIDLGERRGYASLGRRVLASLVMPALLARQ